MKRKPKVKTELIPIGDITTDPSRMFVGVDTGKGKDYTAVAITAIGGTADGALFRFWRPPYSVTSGTREKFTITKSFRFEASHVLDHHDGKCGELHGHSYMMTVEVEGDRITEWDSPQPGPSDTGMLVDYQNISKVVDPWIEELLDHKHLNESLDMDSPTAEAIAQMMYHVLAKSIPGLRSITINETESTSARYEMTSQEPPRAGLFKFGPGKFAVMGVTGGGTEPNQFVWENKHPFRWMTSEYTGPFCQQRFALRDADSPITITNEEELMELLADWERYKQVKEAASVK